MIVLIRLTVFDVCFIGTPITDGICKMGKYGGIVSISQSDSSIDVEVGELQEIGNTIAQHVVGMNPTSLGTQVMNDEQAPSNSVDQQKADDAESGASQKKSKKSKKKTSGVEETRLMHQEFLMDEDLTVAEYCAEANVTINDFVRFECGEEIDD